VRSVKFVKRKKSGLGDEWRQMHVTYVDVDVAENIKTAGKPTIPEEVIYKADEVEILRGFMNSFGIHNYRIVYHEKPINDIRVDEISDLLDKYPECEMGGFQEVLECLEEKTGKKYFMVYLEPGRLAVAEIL
jgi:hypothetical protein